MLFNSYPFLFLTLTTFFLYYSSAFEDYQIYILIFSSTVFYGYSQPYLLLLLFFSASVNAVASYWVFAGKKSKKKVVATTGVVFNLLVLAFFKYNKLLEPDVTAGLVDFIVLLPLPIGISFYTFQGISLLMDVYKPMQGSKVEVNTHFGRHYRDTLFFISFFPQLVAGPIVKAHSFFPQIGKKYIQGVDFDYVLRVLILGYFLKSVIADNLKDQTFWIAYPYFEFQSSLTLISMLVGYSIQIFSDFAGYSLIAIGIAALFGYKLPQNFNYPYISASITEFWGRWHISLSSWLKEYLYIGLGGNRKGNLRTYANLMIVMFLGGLWHGAAISYGIWGLWHGVGLAVERTFSDKKRNKQNLTKFTALARMILVFAFVSVGWLFFKLTNVNEAVSYLYTIKNNMGIAHNKTIIINILLYSLPVFFYHIVYLVRQSGIKGGGYSLKRFDYMAYAIMLLMVIVNGGIPGEFVYFQF